MARIDLSDLDRMIAERYVSVQKHPEADLWIYNYTPKAQYERIWNETTMACRGLILDADRRVQARPFAKFFNYGEIQGQQFPAEPFEIYDKMDGSLGILYEAGGELAIATRGSFTSWQAVRATRILRERYGGVRFDPWSTYLFEIILPENRIVVDYGGREDVVLLAVVDTETGEEWARSELEHVGVPLVECFGTGGDIDALPVRANAEGFVLRWPSTNQRVKVKYEEYLRIHRLVTGLSARHVWEMLRAGDDPLVLADHVPDEFHKWLEDCVQGLRAGYAEIERAASAAYVDLGDRKTNAARYQEFRYPWLLFSMLDGKPYGDAIWKILRPGVTTPFRSDEG